jgi:SAM-dependent methyltransferase
MFRLRCQTGRVIHAHTAGARADPSRSARSGAPGYCRAVPPGDHVAAARAVYGASSERYIEFVGTEISSATEAPIDRALRNAFVELVRAGTSRRVADVGCGPGRAAAFLAQHDLDVIGFDVSPAMLAAARTAHPEIHFEEGRLDDLPLAHASLAGVVCWYSIIYTPPDHLGAVFTELERVLNPGGHLLLGFQAGSGDPVHRPEAHGTPFSLTGFRHSPADVTNRLELAGLEVRATAVSEADFEHEQTPRRS